jgi:hypothetical protein
MTYLFQYLAKISTDFGENLAAAVLVGAIVCAILLRRARKKHK